MMSTKSPPAPLGVEFHQSAIHSERHAKTLLSAIPRPPSFFRGANHNPPFVGHVPDRVETRAEPAKTPGQPQQSNILYQCFCAAFARTNRSWMREAAVQSRSNRKLPTISISRPMRAWQLPVSSLLIRRKAAASLAKFKGTECPGQTPTVILLKNGPAFLFPTREDSTPLPTIAEKITLLPPRHSPCHLEGKPRTEQIRTTFRSMIQNFHAATLAERSMDMVAHMQKKAGGGGQDFLAGTDARPASLCFPFSPVSSPAHDELQLAWSNPGSTPFEGPAAVTKSAEISFFHNNAKEIPAASEKEALQTLVLPRKRLPNN